MKKKSLISLSLLSLFSLNAYANNKNESNIETLVFVRHAEKPSTANDNGMLTCQGFNRAIKLPQVLVSKYGTPDFIFTSSASEKKSSSNSQLSQARPFLTIAPTATKLGMPVNASYEETDVKDFTHELSKSKYANNTLFISWEHKNLTLIARSLYSLAGNNAADIPDWDNNDFDSIWILKIARNSSGSISTVTYSRDSENLNGQSEYCPE